MYYFIVDTYTPDIFGRPVKNPQKWLVVGLLVYFITSQEQKTPYTI